VEYEHVVNQIDHFAHQSLARKLATDEPILKLGQRYESDCNITDQN
jgi:hypothetical protein